MPGILLNGEPRETKDGETVEQALRSSGLDPASLIVLLNGDVLEGAALSTKLKEGDSVDLLKLAGGG